MNNHKNFANFFTKYAPKTEKELISIIAFQLSVALYNGHICIDINEYNNSLSYLNNDDSEDFINYYKPLDVNKIKELSFLFDISDLKQDYKEIKKPFVLLNNKLYLQRYFFYETNIINNLKIFLDTTNKFRETYINNLLKNSVVEELKKSFNVKENSDNFQYFASLNSLINQFSIITGGPGTGKTYTVTKILPILSNLFNLKKLAMVAPTGKAAIRLKESLLKHNLNLNFDVEASTIHSLLGVQYSSNSYKHNNDNKLDYDLIIIDEASMIDVSLINSLFDAINIEKTRVIMLGDKNQLASVDAGSIFGDFTKNVDNIDYTKSWIYRLLKDITDGSNNINSTNKFLDINNVIVPLTESRRFGDDSEIGRFSKAILSGDKKQYDKILTSSKESIYIIKDENELNDLIKNRYNFLKEKSDVELTNKLNQFKIFCATKEGVNSVEYINSLTKKLLNLNREKTVFYNNQIVMVSKNRKELGVFNGEIGIVKSIDNNYYLFLEGDRKIPIALISNYQEAYAITVHKSQGSDYDEILFVLPEYDLPLLTKELVYTAITRAKKRVYIYDKANILINSLNRSVTRTSAIVERIQSWQ